MGCCTVLVRFSTTVFAARMAKGTLLRRSFAGQGGANFFGQEVRKQHSM
jgi:hypothetical protein